MRCGSSRSLVLSSPLLLFVLLVASAPLTYSTPFSHTPGVYDYYWFREGVYFTYIVEFPVPLPVTRRTIGGNPTVIGHVDYLVVNWSIMEIRGDWFYVNYTVSLELRPGGEEYVFSRLIKVNTRTLEAYARYVGEDDPRTVALRPILSFFPRDEEGYIWLGEFLFILRPGSRFKLAADFFAGVGDRYHYFHPSHFECPSDNPYAFCFHEVYNVNISTWDELVERIREFTTSMSRILEKYPYWRGLNYTELALVFNQDGSIYYIACPVPSNGRRPPYNDVFIVSGILLEDPPTERGYSYGNVTLSADRLARARGGNPDLAVREIRNWGSSLVDRVLLDPVNEVVVVLSNGVVLCVEAPSSIIMEAVYDIVTGVLVEMHIHHVMLEGVLYFEDLRYIAGIFIHPRPIWELSRQYNDFRVEFVRVKLADTNISFERPVIGVKPPVTETLVQQVNPVDQPLEPRTPVTFKPGETPPTARRDVDLYLITGLVVVTATIVVVLVASKIRK